MTRATRKDQLEHVAFFETLPESLRWHLVRAGVPTTYDAGAILFREGDPREFFAVVLSGSVAIEHAETSPRSLRSGPAT